MSQLEVQQQLSKLAQFLEQQNEDKANADIAEVNKKYGDASLSATEAYQKVCGRKLSEKEIEKGQVTMSKIASSLIQLKKRSSEHQVAVAAALALGTVKNKRQFLVSPCGSGKTRIIAGAAVSLTID